MIQIAMGGLSAARLVAARHAVNPLTNNLVSNITCHVVSLSENISHAVLF